MINLAKVTSFLCRFYQKEKSWKIMPAANWLHPYLQSSDG
jgi:hypothetical protein